MALPHWEFFLSLDDDLYTVSRYIKFDARNFATFSVELSRIIVLAGSEVDAALKVLCKSINPSSKADRINQYGKEVLGKYNKLEDTNIKLPRHAIIRAPLAGWHGSSPHWWRSFTALKHDRENEIESATLATAIDAVGSLLVIISYLYYSQSGRYQIISRGEEPKLINLVKYSDPNWEQGVFQLIVDL